MKIQLNKNIVISALLIMIYIILTKISYIYELYLLGISIQDIKKCLIYLIIFIIGYTSVNKVKSLSKSNPQNNMLCLTITVIFIFMELGAFYLSNELYSNEHFYELEMEGDSYDEIIMVKEYELFYRTAGTFYIKISPVLLKVIPHSFYGEETGIYPIGSDEYVAKYNKETNQIEIYRIDESKIYPYHFFTIS